MTDLPPFRWVVRITYRTENGPNEVEHHVEEIRDAHDLVERGPDWNTIEQIVITLNPRRVSHPGDTVEAAERR